MAKPKLPDLAPTGRRYLEDTLRVRLQSPGVERYATRPRRGGAALAVALVLGAALVAGMAWLAR